MLVHEVGMNALKWGRKRFFTTLHFDIQLNSRDWKNSLFVRIFLFDWLKELYCAVLECTRCSDDDDEKSKLCPWGSFLTRFPVEINFKFGCQMEFFPLLLQCDKNRAGNKAPWAAWQQSANSHQDSPRHIFKSFDLFVGFSHTIKNGDCYV